MQSAINSFYVALRTRLAELNPERTTFADGVSQPAILLAQNQRVTAAKPLAECFYLQFGRARDARALPALMMLECSIAYGSEGAALDGSGRGRGLAVLDSELLQICSPPNVSKLDYTQSPPRPLGTNVFWSQPQLGELQDAGGTLRRTATLTIFFFPEVSA